MTVISSSTTKKIKENGVEVVVEVEEHSVENFRDFEILFFETGLHKNYLLNFEYKVLDSLEPISESEDGEGNFHTYDTIVEDVNIIGEKTLVNGYEVFEGSVTRVTLLDGGINGYFYKTNIAAIQHFSQEDLGKVFDKIWELVRTRNLRMENVGYSYMSYRNANKRLSKSLMMFFLIAVITAVAAFTRGVGTLDTVDTVMLCLIFMLSALPVTINTKDGVKIKRELEENHRLALECMDKRVFQEMWKNG